MREQTWILAMLMGVTAGTLVGCSGAFDGAGSTSPPTPGAPSPSSPGVNGPGVGNVATGGGQDFGAFRRALNENHIPAPSTLDAAGFFAEHFTSLPLPTCGKTFCLHGMLSVSPDMVHGGDWTLLQMGMNSPVDPSTVAKPPLDLVVVLDRSGSMAEAGKMEYAKQGIKLLIDQLGEEDTFTLVAFESQVQTMFGPQRIGTNRVQVKAIVDRIQPLGGTNIYGGLEAGYKAALAVGDETQQRRVIFLTDGLPTSGVTNGAQIKTMSAGYNAQYIGLTTIGLGSDVDAALLRELSEQGGGNFYFAEKPAAVQEVFSEELAFFVAPIAYDLELSINELPSYKVKQVHGTNLWRTEGAGGQLRVPSVFLVSRTSSAPGASGGRRGGGSAIIAELSTTPLRPVAGACDVATLRLSYRQPGSTTIETQEATIAYTVGDQTDDSGFYSTRDVEKNTIILGLFIALRDATARAQVDPRGARELLATFQPKFKARIAGWADDDLIDDIVILQQYLDVLATRVGINQPGI
jgi:Ca-activated chloride channel family protein